MRYEVTLRGPRTADAPHGTIEAVIVEAETGDEAVERAFQPYRIVTSVQPVTPETVHEMLKPRKAKA